jgi:hypothetical protein
VKPFQCQTCEPPLSGLPVSQLRFGADVSATRRRVRRLERYMSEHVLDGKRFVCASQRDARGRFRRLLLHSCAAVPRRQALRLDAR